MLTGINPFPWDFVGTPEESELQTACPQDLLTHCVIQMMIMRLCLAVFTVDFMERA